MNYIFLTKKVRF